MIFLQYELNIPSYDRILGCKDDFIIFDVRNNKFIFAPKNDIYVWHFLKIKLQLSCPIISTRRQAFATLCIQKSKMAYFRTTSTEPEIYI